MNYTPPNGYIDQPYFWCFDTDEITDGSTVLNRAINLPGGYDFVLRRITGLDSALNPTTGKWNWRSASTVRNIATQYMENPSKWADRLIIPEIVYPETGAINFDLLNTLSASITVDDETIKYGQIAFQGARRRQGREVNTYGRPFRRVPYQIEVPIVLDWDYASNQRIRKFAQTVDNFDFEAHAIYWTVDYPSSYDFIELEQANLTVFSKLNAAIDGPYSIVVVVAGLNTPLSISVVGPVITINLSTDGAGVNTATFETVTAAILASAEASALIEPVATITIPNTIFNFAGTYVLIGGAFKAPLANYLPTYGAIAKFNLFDYANNGLMPVPMRIEYLNEPIPYGSLATYQSGALLPVLLYPKDSSIQVEIVSLKPANLNSIALNMTMIGMQRIPC